MDILLNVLVLFGLISVGLAFIVLLPMVGQLIVSVFTTVFVEKLLARLRNVESGTTMTAPVGAPPTKREPLEHHGPTPIYVYICVYLALIVLTVVTVGVSELGLPMKQAVFWAVVVASTKAALVIGWFMHVRGGPALNRFVLSTSFFFMAVFFTLTMADLSTRDWTSAEESHWTPIEEAMESGEQPTGWSSRVDAPEQQE